MELHSAGRSGPLRSAASCPLTNWPGICRLEPPGLIQRIDRWAQDSTSPVPYPTAADSVEIAFLIASFNRSVSALPCCCNLATTC